MAKTIHSGQPLDAVYNLNDGSNGFALHVADFIRNQIEYEGCGKVGVKRKRRRKEE